MKKRKYITLTAAVVLIVIEFICIINQRGEIRELQRQIDALNEQITYIQGDYAIEDKWLQLQIDIQKKRIDLLNEEEKEAKEEQAECQEVEEPTQTKEETKKQESSGDTSNTGKATITYYCACGKCNGSYSYTENGINYTATASGITLHDGMSGNYCAATFGSLGDIVTINGTDYKIIDRMGGSDGKRVDIFCAEGHERCNELGRYTAEVTLKNG